MTNGFGPGLERVLDSLDNRLAGLSSDVQALDTKLDEVKLRYVHKDDYQSDRMLRRTMLMWGLGIMVTIALATWTLIATRSDPVIIEQTTRLLGWML